jgi:phage-related protein
MFHALVNLPSFIADLVVTVIAFAIDKLGEIISTVGQEIQTAVDKIVDAFQAFVDWAVEFVQQLISSVLDPLVDSLTGAIDGFVSQIEAAYNMTVDDIEQTGQLSLAALSALREALFSPLFWVVAGLGIIIQALLVALSPISLTFGFIAGMAISFIVVFVVYELVGIISSSQWFQAIPGAFSDIWGWMEDNFGPGEDAPSEDQVAWSAFGGCMSVISVFYSLPDMLKSISWRAICLGIGVLSIAVGWAATGINSYGLGLIAIALGAVSLIPAGIDMFMATDRILAGIVMACGVIGIECGHQAL